MSTTSNATKRAIERRKSVGQLGEVQPVYGHPLMSGSLPTETFPEEGTAARVANQLIMDELTLDGNPKMNLGSFVTTYMEPEADQLMLSAMRKNFIDLDQYPQTTEIHSRCIRILANLYNAPLKDGEKAIGTGCIGSSEAIMLASLAMKRNWRNRRQAQGLPCDKPNFVCGANIQVCWHKMANYFEVELREAPVSQDCLVLTADRARELLDENTIGVCAVLGSTINGEYEDVKAIHDMLVEVNEEKGWNIPLHVDAASGGFIAPFIQPELVWDFRLPNVRSINVSGHKFGLVYAGIGWALWRTKEDLPEDLVFHVNYLGGDQSSLALNFSKGASTTVAQYYNILRFGKSGYRRIMQCSMENARYLRESLEETGYFRIVDKASMPLVAFALKDTEQFTCFDIQDKLRTRGWIVPAYTCPTGAEDLVIMRVVVKQNFAFHMVDMLIEDIKKAIDSLEKHHKVMSAAYKAVSTFQDAVKEKIPSKDEITHTLRTNLKHRNSMKSTHGVC